MLKQFIEKKEEAIAMNIVYQLDDDSGLSVEFRQANNDKRIDFVQKLLHSSLQDFATLLRSEIEGRRKAVNLENTNRRGDLTNQERRRMNYNQALTDILALLDK